MSRRPPLILIPGRDVVTPREAALAKDLIRQSRYEADRISDLQQRTADLLGEKLWLMRILWVLAKRAGGEIRLQADDLPASDNASLQVTGDLRSSQDIVIRASSDDDAPGATSAI